MATEGRGIVVGDEDPHAKCRIDRYLYLVIGENGEYSYSHKPKEIPKDVVVEAIAADKCRVGIRHFKVHKAGTYTYDLFSVGTITVQNGYAYAAGHFIHGEAPDRYNEFIVIPPFVITYPLQLPDGMDLEKYGIQGTRDQIREQMRPETVGSDEEEEVIERNEDDDTKRKEEETM